MANACSEAIYWWPLVESLSTGQSTWTSLQKIFHRYSGRLDQIALYLGSISYSSLCDGIFCTLVPSDAHVERTNGDTGYLLQSLYIWCHYKSPITTHQYFAGNHAHHFNLILERCWFLGENSEVKDAWHCHIVIIVWHMYLKYSPHLRYPLWNSLHYSSPTWHYHSNFVPSQCYL